MSEIGHIRRRLLFNSQDPDGAHMHQDPFFEQNKASALLDLKTDPGNPHLEFYKKIFGVIIFLIT